MALPYNEKAFKQLQTRLNDKTQNKVHIIVRDLFNNTPKETLYQLVNAVVRVAKTKGFPAYTIIGGPNLWDQEFIFYRKYEVGLRSTSNVKT